MRDGNSTAAEDPFDSIAVGEARDYATLSSAIDKLSVFRMSPENLDPTAFRDMVVNATVSVDLSGLGLDLTDHATVGAVDRVLRRLYGSDVTLESGPARADTAAVVVAVDLPRHATSVSELTTMVEEWTPVRSIRSDADTGTLQQNLRAALR